MILFYSSLRGFVISNLHLDLDSFLCLNETPGTPAWSLVLMQVNGIFGIWLPWLRFVPVAPLNILTPHSAGEAHVKAVTSC